MKKIRTKTLRLRLDANSCRKLHRRVLERDGWRCQVCGSMRQLQVHHLKFRSRSGGDEEQNLITLCAECHASLHRKTNRTRPAGSDRCSSMVPYLYFRFDQPKMTNMVILPIIMNMKTVKISDLKAHLSAHIQLVKDGEEVLVCDRDKPVARIVPCRLAGHSQQEQRLVARGVLTLPLKKRSASVSWPLPPGSVSDEIMEQVRQEEREGR